MSQENHTNKYKIGERELIKNLNSLSLHGSDFSRHGRNYRLVSKVPTDDNLWGALYLVEDSRSIEGKLKIGLGGTEVFFIPEGLQERMKTSFIFRGFSSNEQLGRLEGEALGRFDIIHLEDLNELEDKLFFGCLEGEITPEAYLAQFQNATGIHYRSGVITSLLERIRQSQDWYREGKIIHRPIFSKKNKYNKNDLTDLNIAKEEHDKANIAFKQTPLGTLSFDDFIELGKKYVSETLGYTRARIRETIYAVTDRSIELILSGKPSSSMGFLVSTAHTTVSDEVSRLWNGQPIEVNEISLDQLALIGSYPKVKNPASPLVKARHGLITGKITNDHNLTLLMAQEAAFQVIRRKIEPEEIRDSRLGTVETDYLASLSVQNLNFYDCKQIYEKFLVSKKIITEFI